MSYQYKLSETALLAASTKRGRLITARELAEYIGVSLQSVYVWRRGVTHVNATYTAQLCQALDCGPADVWELVEIEQRARE